MKKFSALFCAIATALVMQAPAMAATDVAAGAAPRVKKTIRSAAKKLAPSPPASLAEDDEDKEPDTLDFPTTDYDCELGNKVTIYRNAGDDLHIALRWKKRLHRLTRVKTSTGADRFENRFYGLVWIGIPAKSMLLDSKKGQQLANECKSPEQLKPEPNPAVLEPAAPETPDAPKS
ncbi:MAG: hypothetical protein V4805_19790 [Pseudomonadota bacterium]